MLQAITFIKDWRCFKIDDAFAFQDGVNLLVGDQGTGKSSLLSAIRGNGVKVEMGDPDWHKEAVAELVTNGKQCNSFKFDFEKDNFRTKGWFGGKTIAFHMRSMWKSHGEQNNAVLKNMAPAKDSVIFMDEPDMALSIRSAIKLVELLTKLADAGNQILAAVHHPIVIEAFPLVLSLEHGMWIPSDMFIASQYEEAADE